MSTRNRNDRSYKEVRRTIVRNQRKKTKEIAYSEEGYIDSYRSVAVHLGGSDLKSSMKPSGMNHPTFKHDTNNDGLDETMYLKQAEHLMKRGIFGTAVMYLETALLYNPTSKYTQATRAKCYLLMGQWAEACLAADTVLDEDKTYVKALMVKAEALYNTCDFEHALVLFHRGQALAPETEDFRLGIQKCRKTIHSTVNPKFDFWPHGVETLYDGLQKTCEVESSMNEAEYLTEKQQRKLEQNHQESFEGDEVSDANESHWMAKKKSKTTDRLLEDKEYLGRLASGIGDPLGTKARGSVTNKISRTAREALNFLEARDEFWKQVELCPKGVAKPVKKSAASKTIS